MPKRNLGQEEDGSDEDAASLIDVDFDFFDPAPIDFIAIKRLLSQLFQADSEDLNVHELTELIISQPLLGTTVKTDGINSDPYAFLTVLNMNVHQNHPSIRALSEYLLSKTSGSPPMRQTLEGLLGPSSTQHVGLILSERLINMPVQIAPPMYQLLGDEIRWAIEENEPYHFTYFLCISRTYRISSEAEQSGEAVPPPPSKRLKPSGADVASSQFLSYHEEDEILDHLASHVVHFPYTNQPTRESGVIGADVAAKVMLIPASKYSELISELQEHFSSQ